MVNPMDLGGRQYIVTGASSGLGRQTCVTLSQLGARLTLIARNEERLCGTISMMERDGHDYYSYDLSDIDGIEELVTSIVARNGKYDGMVHCAGIGTSVPISMSKYTFMKRMMDINFFSFVEIVRVLIKKKNSNNGASFVAVSSVASKYTDKCKLGYTSSKGALDSAVKAMAVELGVSRKMRFNTVNPGWMRTEMYDWFAETTSVEHAEKTLSTHVLGIAEPVEAANTIAFLLSDMSSKITGQNIFIDSGWTINSNRD